MALVRERERNSIDYESLKRLCRGAEARDVRPASKES